MAIRTCFLPYRPYNAVACDELLDGLQYKLRTVMVIGRSLHTNASLLHGETDFWSGSREELLTFMHDMGPPTLLDEAAVAAYVAAGEMLGLPFWEEEGERRYDLLQAWNWFYEHTPAYFSAELNAKRLTRARSGFVPEARPQGRCCPEQHAATPARILTNPLTMHATVRVTLDTQGMAPDTPLRAFIPYPLNTDAQRHVQLQQVSSPALAAARVPEAGYIYGADLLVGSAPELVLEYVCTLTTHEVHAHGFQLPGHRLEPTQPIADVLDRVRRCTDDPYQRAWLLYDWIIGIARYAKTPTPCACIPCCARDFSTHPATHCIVIAHAFVHFCREVGVQARPVRGMMFTHPRDASGQRFGCSYRRSPVIAHTWAEFEAPGVGWLPVEFEAIYLKAVSPVNCPDPVLRRTIAADYDFYRRIYFGNIDHQRLVFSQNCIDIPYLLALAPEQPPGSRWRPVDPKRIRYTLEVEL